MALRQVPVCCIPSRPCLRKRVVPYFAVVALQFEALLRVPILRALCIVDAELSSGLEEGSEIFASFYGLLHRTLSFLTIFAPPLHGCTYVDYEQGQRAEIVRVVDSARLCITWITLWSLEQKPGRHQRLEPAVLGATKT